MTSKDPTTGNEGAGTTAAPVAARRPRKPSRRVLAVLTMTAITALAVAACGSLDVADDDPHTGVLGELSVGGSIGDDGDAFAEFEPYTWTFPIAEALDAVGENDGLGELYIRLFVPETVDGETYPLVANLGGLGDNASINENSYARLGVVSWSNPTFQEKYPSYVMTVTVPWEAAVNYEAEMAYMYEIGQAIRAIGERVENIDMSRIYATGMSQGAGWSYEAAAAQPDLFAGLFINSGTAVHSTWGDQIDLDRLSDVSIYLVHGAQDIYIPVNEAYRVFNALKAKGHPNLRLDVVEGGHVLRGTDFLPPVDPDGPGFSKVYHWQEWLFSQTKDMPASEPVLNETVRYGDYLWAGALVLPVVESWATDVDYAEWVEALDNPTWDRIKQDIARPTVSGASTGTPMVGRFRIGDETQTTYDEFPDREEAFISAGQSLYMTIQGYTGQFGDDFAAFNDEWNVDWAVLEGDVTDIVVTNEASATPIARPDTVNLTNGGGPNRGNSLATDNVLDGEQVYLKISLLDEYSGGNLKVGVRFTRSLGSGNFGTDEYASYWHIVDLPVK